jgi:hypothetical protein
LKRLLDEAMVLNAPIFIYGDFFCAMQGKYDPRASKGDIRPEHQVVNYLDALVDTAAEWLKPYAKNIVMIANGNHETSIAKRAETLLTDRLCYKIRSDGGIAQEAGYQGFIRWHFETGDRKDYETWFQHHGFGGGGPVTKGMIDFNRMASWYEADVYLAGHIHRLNKDRSSRYYLSKSGKLQERVVDFIRMSTFKRENIEPFGWGVEKGHGPRSIGGWWCTHTLKEFCVKRIASAEKSGDLTKRRLTITRQWTEAC